LIVNDKVKAFRGLGSKRPGCRNRRPEILGSVKQGHRVSVRGRVDRHGFARRSTLGECAHVPVPRVPDARWDVADGGLQAGWLFWHTVYHFHYWYTRIADLTTPSDNGAAVKIAFLAHMSRLHSTAENDLLFLLACSGQDQICDLLRMGDQGKMAGL
jgi:hypothetical protein